MCQMPEWTYGAWIDLDLKTQLPLMIPRRLGALLIVFPLCRTCIDAILRERLDRIRTATFGMEFRRTTLIRQTHFSDKVLRDGRLSFSSRL